MFETQVERGYAMTSFVVGRCVRRGPHVKQHAQPKDKRDPLELSAPQVGVSVRSRAALTSVQETVLECLGASHGGMTMRQLENAVGCGADELRPAVEGLMSDNLVFRLNTIIPSYASKYPGVRVYGE